MFTKFWRHFHEIFRRFHEFLERISLNFSKNFTQFLRGLIVAPILHLALHLVLTYEATKFRYELTPPCTYKGLQLYHQQSPLTKNKKNSVWTGTHNGSETSLNTVAQKIVRVYMNPLIKDEQLVCFGVLLRNEQIVLSGFTIKVADI